MLEKFSWRKLGALFLALFLIAGLAACGQGGASTPADGKSAGTSTGSPTLDAIKQRGKLVAGVKYDTKLFGYKDPATGKVEGFDVDLARLLAEKILGDPNKVELVEVTSKTRIPMLKNGDIDVIIATMTITKKRMEEIDFSNAYYVAGQSLLVPKGSRIRGIQDLDENTTVIGVKGSTSVQNIREKAPKAKVAEYDNYAEAFNALRSGKGDALTTDNVILLGMHQQDPNYVLVGGLFTTEPYGIGIRKGDRVFVEYVNEFLKEIKANGKYAEIYKKWLQEEPQEKDLKAIDGEFTIPEGS
ncbi:transporter substrate-binding domain-containing protein [Brockia lithotrophica]|uniref:Amino acid ABC transporter substrate-binding protein (PAAT family) n=1 Tax=Brockia lithotrophica TaxID=933949 RepID=A0A660KZ59_9BACL|nr:transporter substrate-binding domain-containing protein [Brockia lithotrophica]RKQ83693.1 amino acid ABC transporter substrate-binding protein (PAAT family) [Brockia lithotrophica]